MRSLLPLIAVVLAFLTLSSSGHAQWFRANGMRCPGGSSACQAPPPTTCAINSVCTTQTVKNTSGSTVASVPFVFGQVFARGDVANCLTSKTPVPDDHTGSALTYQIDQAGTWDDGSCRHLVYSILSPSITAGSTEQLQFSIVSGAYTPGTDPRSNSDFTTGHQYQMQMTDIRDRTNTIVGSGNATADVGTCVGDGTFSVNATGPVRREVTVYCPAIDTSPSTTTVTGSLTAGATGSVVVGTMAGFPTDTTTPQIVKIDHEYILAKYVDSTHLNLVTRGAMWSTAASHSAAATVTYVGHIWVEFYFNLYTASGGSLYAIGSMPRTSLPWINVTGPDFYSYQAVYTDVSVGTIKAWNNTVSIVQGGGAGGSPIDTTAGTIDLGSNPWEPNECVEMSSTGTLPGTFAAHTPYWVLYSPSTTKYSFYAHPWDQVAGNGHIAITSVGSGTLTLTRRTCTPYRTGWYSAADDQGHANFTANATALKALYPSFCGNTSGSGTACSPKTNSELLYWEQAGFVPPYRTNIFPTAMSTSGTRGGYDDSGLYRPQIAVLTQKALGIPGDPPGEGPLPDWQSIAWLRQDQTGWDEARAGALGHAHMPWVEIINEATGRIQPWNDGPLGGGQAGTGGSYSQLGAPQPSLVYNGNHQNIITVPPNLVSNFGWASGIWDLSGGDGSAPSQGHWPGDPYLAYLVFGEQWLLDDVYREANRAIGVFDVPTTDPFYGNRFAQVNGSGTTYHAIMPVGKGRAASSYKGVVFGATMGADANQEKSYFADVLNENLNWLGKFVSLQSTPTAAGWNPEGYLTWTVGGGDGLTTWWAENFYLWGRNLFRNSNWDVYLDADVNHFKSRWGDVAGCLSSYYGNTEYDSMFIYPYTSIFTGTYNWNGNYVTQFPSDCTHMGWSETASSGSHFNATAASPTVITITGGSGVAAGTNLQQGDLFKCTTPVYFSSAQGASYSGPPECKPGSNPSANAEWFYVCNPSASSGATVTLNIASDSGCTTLIGFASSWSSQQYTIKYQYAPGTGSCVYTNSGCTGFDPLSQAAQNWMGMHWLESLGYFAPTDTSITNIEARVLIPNTGGTSWTSNPKLSLTNVTIH